MTLTATAELVDDARARGGAVGAFNVLTLEHAEAIVRGAERAGRAVILQVSHNAVRFHGGQVAPLAAACRAVAVGSSVGVALHLDHVETEELAALAATAGFSSLMIDASRLPFAQNVSTTSAVARRARRQGLWVEAELGEIGGKDGAHAPGVRTDPAQAAAFVAATGVCGLAVAVGSSHAMLDRSARLDLDLVARLRAELPVPLVLHGSSGVPDRDLRDAVRAGVTKVNIGTALNVAWTAAVRSTLAGAPELVDPRVYLRPARDAAADVVARLLGVLAGTVLGDPGETLIT